MKNHTHSYCKYAIQTRQMKISILDYLWNQLILSNYRNKLNMQNLVLQLFKQVYDDANKWIYTSPCAHAPMKTKCMGPKGIDAPVSHDVSSHRALKIQQNWDIWVVIETFKDTLQMNFSYINKMTSFTNIMTNVGNHKIEILLKTSQNVCSPLNYGLNTINKQDINSPR